MANVTKPIPSPTDATRPFWSGCASGVLRLRRCAGCGRFRGPSRLVCDCGRSDHVWTDVSGRGEIFSYTVVHRAPDPAFRAEVPYVVAVIELEEGPHLLGNFVECSPDGLSIGMPVHAVFEEVAPEIGMVKFKPGG
jgi:uncharacterized OB-fold protein